MLRPSLCSNLKQKDHFQRLLCWCSSYYFAYSFQFSFCLKFLSRPINRLQCHRSFISLSLVMFNSTQTRNTLVLSYFFTTKTASNPVHNRTACPRHNPTPKYLKTANSSKILHHCAASITNFDFILETTMFLADQVSALASVFIILA